MNNHEPTLSSSTSSGIDLAVAHILEAYLADVEAGQPRDPQQLLVENPARALSSPN